MKQNENKMVDKEEDWHDECETEWNNMDKQNKPNTTTQKAQKDQVRLQNNPTHLTFNSFLNLTK